MVDVSVSFNGMESSDALKDYAVEKISKHEVFLEDATAIDVTLRESIHTRGVDKDFKVVINVTLPKAVIRVEEVGADMYALLDTASDTLKRRLKRYHDKKENWSGTTPWKVLEAEEEMEDDGVIEEDNYVGYVPKIAVRHKLTDMSPMNEGEAVEKMELMGDAQILFKNVSTGKFSMIYRLDDGSYALVEPDDVLEA